MTDTDDLKHFYEGTLRKILDKVNDLSDRVAALEGSDNKELSETKRGLDITKTERGFALIVFKDRYNFGCSLQKSSLAEEDCIWFGVHEDRMLLTRDQLNMLMPYLNRFVKTGEL